jgi:hypothetical protein
LACWGGFYMTSPPSGTFVRLGAGYRHACAIKADATLSCWGYNSFQQATPPAAGSFFDVTGGVDHSCALRSADGSAVCWGLNDSNQLNVPLGSAPLTNITAGSRHTCALRTDGSAVCWGMNTFGQASPPTGPFTQISAGEYHTCAMRSNGSVVCWGYSDFGTSSPPSFGPARQFPVATFGYPPAPVIVGASIALSLTGAQVPGHPEATTFTYAFDCGDGSGYGVASSISDRSCPTSGAGIRIVKGKVIDQDGDAAEYAGSVEVVVPPQQPQTVGFTSVIPNPAYVATTYAVTATASSNLAVTLSLTAATPASVCTIATTVSGSAVTFVGVGVCTVAANQAGDGNNFAAAQQTQIINVVKQPQTVGFVSAAPSPAYVGTAYTIGASATSALAVVHGTSSPGICTVSGNLASFVAEGTCVLTADQGGDATFTAATQATQSVTVSRRPQTINIAPTQATAIVLSTLTLSATGGSSGNAVIFATQSPASCTSGGANGQTLSFIAAGTCTVLATQVGNNTYADAAPLSVSINVLSGGGALNELFGKVLDAAPSLAPDLQKVIDAVGTNGVCGKLGAFVNKLEAQAASLTVPQSTLSEWLNELAAIKKALGC